MLLVLWALVLTSHQFDYVTVRQAKGLQRLSRFSVIGAVVTCGDIKPTRTNGTQFVMVTVTQISYMLAEFMRILHLTDDSTERDETLVVQCFSRKKEWLPSVKAGQVVLFRKLKVHPH